MKLIRFVGLIFVEYLLILIKSLGSIRAFLNLISTNVVLSDVDTFKKLLKQPKICQQLKRLLDEIHPIVGEHNDPHFIEHMTTIVDVSDVDNVCFNINLTLVISRQQFFFALTENINCNIIA